MNFEQRSKLYREHVEKTLADFYAPGHELPQKILFESMEYSLLAHGKRLRPIFAYDFCRMCGENFENAAPFAAAIEMIHNYSLIHDDLPCMDNDDYRRGRLTNHKVYGETLAVLAGDGLLTDAFAMASQAKLRTAEDMALAIRTLSQNAGSLGMVGGQVLDTMSEDRVCSEQEVLDIQNRKTGGLIRAACVLGVIAGHGTAEQRTAAGVFADALGLAFQIRDDMLDVIGTEEEMGKGVGTDAGKNTFVRLYGLDTCEKMVKSYTEKAVSALSAFQDTEYMEELARSLTDRRV